MKTLFDQDARKSISERLASLPADALRQWGRMDAAQMLAHCSAALAVGTGDTPRRQVLIGRILAPFFRASILGEKPFGRNSPTDPTFVVSDPRDFEREKARLLDLVARFCDRGAAGADAQTHSFLGRISGEEWGVMMYKHLDHHLRQFGG